MRYKVILFLAVMVCCVSCNEAQAGFFPSASERASSLTYAKDSRTGLCFAYNSVWSGRGAPSDVFVNVPCTPEVEKLLQK